MSGVKKQNNGFDSRHQPEGNQRATSSQPPPPQQWAAMQFPAAAVMIPPSHFASIGPYFPHHHQSRGQRQNGSNGENKTIWVGDLDNWMDENYLHSSFTSAGEIASIKVIRNKHTGLSEGYGFVEFFSREIAEKVLQEYAGTVMPNSDQPFRLNWASFSTGDRRPEIAPDVSIFVGDLASDVTDSLLQETFSTKYPSVKAAKVVVDGNTGRSKGYGFVRFGDDGERAKAMIEMNGEMCSSRPMRIGPATPRRSTGYQQGGYATNGTPVQPDGDSSNTTIFVGGLDANVTDEELRQPFADYGEIASVKIPVGKGCGFVQFVNREDAEEALKRLSGTVIGNQTVRLSWGRNPANKQFRNEYGNPWMTPYFGGQYFNGYGYVMPAQYDPRMYAATAAAYGAYPADGGNNQQVS